MTCDQEYYIAFIPIKATNTNGPYNQAPTIVLEFMQNGPQTIFFIVLNNEWGGGVYGVY